MAIAIGAPSLFAVGIYLVRHPVFRRIGVLFTCLLLIATAAGLHYKIGLAPVLLPMHSLDRLVFVLDLVLLGYITYVAFERKHSRLIVLSILQLAGLLYLELVLKPQTANVPTLMIDRLTVVMYLIVSVVGSLICIYALKYMDDYVQHTGKANNHRFFLWFLLFLGAMNGLILSNNLFWMYFFWEATTLCSFQLIGHDDTEEARTNALRALFINSVGGLAFISAIAILAHRFGGGYISLIHLINSDLQTTSTLFLT